MKKPTIFYSIGAVILTGLVALGTWHCLKYAVACQMETSTGAKIENWPDLLKLDANQRQKAAPMLMEFKEEMSRLQTQLAESHISFCKLMMDSQTTEPKKMNQLIDQLAELRKKKDAMTWSHLNAMKEVLRPDQEEILFTTMMQDICAECRTATGMNKDHCGMCRIPT